MDGRRSLRMDRRRYLRWLGTGGLAATAGCTGLADRPTETPTGTPRRTADLPVPESALERGASKDSIPAIVNPAFGDDWSDVELSTYTQFGERRIYPRLADDDRVLGVVREGEARAYPLRVLNWHEVVNDDLGGPLLVTYCPLCGSGVTAVRRVDGERTVFGVSGYLYRSNLVMYDGRTESLWSQVRARAIRGPKVGTRLELVPSSLSTWEAWKDAHPDTVVLLPPPESSTVRGPDATRNYNRNPYAGYEVSDSVGLGRDDYDDRLHPKTLVVGVAHGGEAVAYPLPTVRDERVVNDAVGGLPVVVAATPDDSLVAYVRRVDGETLRFRPADAGRMLAGGSTWEIATGTALDGPYEGTTLEPANEIPPLFWFSWADFHPDTAIYGR